MGRRSAYALVAGAAFSLLVCHSSVAQGQSQQPGGPAVPVQPGGGAGLPTLPGGAGPGMPMVPGGAGPGLPSQPGGAGQGLPSQPGGGAGLPGQSAGGVRSVTPVLDHARQQQQQQAPPSVAPVPQRWREMSPEQRKRVRMNAERWQQMNAEERKAFREQQEWRELRLKREAEAAMRESGLELEAERRAIFERRYIEERRRIDQELRRELREKRQRELGPVLERLKKEVNEPQGKSSGSATPKK